MATSHKPAGEPVNKRARSSFCSEDSSAQPLPLPVRLSTQTDEPLLTVPDRSLKAVEQVQLRGTERDGVQTVSAEGTVIIDTVQAVGTCAHRGVPQLFCVVLYGVQSDRL